VTYPSEYERRETLLDEELSGSLVVFWCIQFSSSQHCAWGEVIFCQFNWFKSFYSGQFLIHRSDLTQINDRVKSYIFFAFKIYMSLSVSVFDEFDDQWRPMMTCRSDVFGIFLPDQLNIVVFVVLRSRCRRLALRSVLSWMWEVLKEDVIFKIPFCICPECFLSCV